MCCWSSPTDYSAIDLSKWIKTINSISKRLHSRKLKPAELDKELVNLTYNHLEKGVIDAFGSSLNKETPIYQKKIKEHLYRFSGVKTYQQLVEMNTFLVDENGKIRSFADFKRKVGVVHKLYNQTYLETEFVTAKLSAYQAKKWQTYEEDADLFPNLIYRTQRDEKVRDKHKKLDGVIKPINDPFWDVNAPLNGFRDRCFLQQTDKPVSKGNYPDAAEKGFRNNVGKTNQVFDEKEHPYFIIPKEDSKLVNEQLDKWINENGKEENT